MDNLKILIRAVAWVAGLILAPLIIYLIYDYIQSRQTLAQEQLVNLTVSYDTDACTQQRPLLVTIRNGSDRTVTSVVYDFDIHLPDHSDNLNRNWRPYVSDRILSPGEFTEQCAEPVIADLANPGFPRGALVYEVTARYIYFQK